MGIMAVEPFGFIPTTDQYTGVLTIHDITTLDITGVVVMAVVTTKFIIHS